MFTTEDDEAFHIKHLSEEEKAKELAARQIAEIIGAEDHVPVIIDVSTDEVGSRVATEWTEGRAFSSIVDTERAKLVGNLTPDEYTRMMSLEYFIANRDRHPGNAMLTDNGKILLIDNGKSMNMTPANAINMFSGTNVLRPHMNRDRELDIITLRQIASRRSTLEEIATGIPSPRMLNKRIDAFSRAVDSIESEGIVGY